MNASERTIDDLQVNARENLRVLKNLLAYLQRHERSLPPMSTSYLEVQIEKTRKLVTASSIPA